MKLHQLLTELAQQGVQLWAEGDKLRLRAPKGVLTAQQRSSITELQPELLRLLQQGKLEQEAYFLPEIVPDIENCHQPFPLSDMQQAYWVGRSEMLELGTAASFYFEIETSNLDLKRLNLAWQQRLHSLPPAPELPLAKNPSSLQKHRFSLLNTQLEPEVWIRLKQRATQLGLTPFIILCAVYAEILTRWSKNPRFTLNILYFNRLPLHPQVNNLVGNFSSTILLEVNNSIQESFLSRTQRLHRQLMQDMEHDCVSGVQVMRELNKNKGDIPRALMPVAMSSIVSQKSALKSEISHNFLDKNQITHSNLQTPQIFLDYGVWEENGALAVHWPFVKEIFPEGMVEEMFAAHTSFLQRLACIIHEPKNKIKKNRNWHSDFAFVQMSE